MIDWQATLKKYVEILYLTQHRVVLYDLCKWYQNQCRVYSDELPKQKTFDNELEKTMPDWYRRIKGG